MHNRPGAKAAPKPAHPLHRAPLLPTKATDVVVVPPPPPVVVSWADRAKRAAQTAAQPNTVEDTAAAAATSSAPRVNPLAHRLALGKKLKRDDLAGLSERDKDALRLYRSLQYRSTEAYKEKQHAQEELRRLKTVERWGKEAIEGPLKPSAVVHVADHLEALTAAGASSGLRTRTAPSAAPPYKPFTFAARGVPLPTAAPPSAPPTETSSVLPTTAVWGKRPTVGHAVKTDAAPSLAASLPVPILPDSSGVTIVKRSRKATSAAIAPVASVAAKSRAGNNKVLSSARAKTASALGGVPRHKERLFRRLKKLTRLKQSILQTRRAALVKAAEAVGIVATKTSPKANIERKVEKESEGTADATQTPLGGIATADEKKQRGSKVRHFDVEGKASAAAKVLLHQLEAVEAIADLQVQARAAYDDREKTLLDKRKHQYAAAVAKMRRQGSHAVRRAVDGAPQEPQSQQDDRADVVDAVANREEDEEDPDEAGEPGDAMTTEVVKPLSDLQHAIARAGSYPVMHLLTGAGSHPAPWLVDLRFVPQQQQPSTQAGKRKKNASTLQPHAEGETDGPSTPPQQHEAAKPTQKGRAPVDLATFRDGLTWAHRPHWWPPARMVRAYVTNTLTRELDKACEVLFDKLRVLQQKLKATQPLKYPKHMRYVLGLREAERGLRAKRVRLVVIAPDVEAVDVLDASIVRIVDMCTANNIPHFFALSRGALGRVFKQFNNRVSLVAMYSAEGAYEECREAVRLGREAKQAFVELRLDPQRSEATSTRDLKESANASSP